MTTMPTTAPDTRFEAGTAHEPDAVVQVAGNLDHVAVPRVAERLHAAVTAGPSEVVVDLENCTFIDATALAQLVDTNTAAYRTGTTLVLRGCPPRIERLLAITGLRRVFTIRD